MVTIVPGINDTATLLTKYKEAVDAYHQLAMGQQLTEGRHSIEMMKFTQTSMPQLAAYISQLAGQLAAQGVIVPGGRTRSRNILHESSVRRRGPL